MSRGDVPFSLKGIREHQCRFGVLRVELQHALISTRFRVYLNSDLVGVELCAAANNVMALAAGGVDGFGFG